jgi:NitT/TauT family transport system permease protein
MSDAPIPDQGSRKLSKGRSFSLRRLTARYGYFIASHLLIILAWQLAVVLGKVPAFILPPPIATLATLGDGTYHWFSNTMTTAAEGYGGYLLGVTAAVALALLFSWTASLERLAMPVLVSFNMIPKVALGPLMIVWFKYGVGPNILIAFSICFFPVLLTTLRGLREVDPDLLDLVHSLRGTKWQLFTKIRFPSALPYLLSGMKVGAVLAVAGAVVGEFLGSERALGYLMMQVQVSLDTPAMFMALLLITLVGMSLYGLVMLLERILVTRDARLG